jgi:hypothetical protein
MSFREINGDIEDFYLVDDSLHFQVNHLETVEKCGFVVNHISADTKIHEGGLEFRNLSILTPHSSIQDKFVMETKDWKDYNDFNNKVKLKGNLKYAQIHSKDLWYFSNNLKNWNTLIRANGEGEGLLTKLKGKNTEVKLYRNTLFKGDWSLTGLPDFDNTILDFDVKQFRTNYADLNDLSLNNIPANFASLGTLEYKGMFSGFYNDFITYGEIYTDIGNFQSDINIKYKEGLDKAVYSGKLKTDFFALQDFISEAEIDNLAFDVNIKGKGLSRDSYDMDVDGKVDQLKFLDHTFRNITANGRISREYFGGHATIDDESLQMEFDGEFRSDVKIPEAHFKAVVKEADLKKMGLDSISQTIQGNFVLDFVGFSLDEAEGSIIGENIIIKRNGSVVSIPYINLSAYEYQNNKELKLRSDLVDARIKGQFRLEVLDISIMHLLHQLIPAYFKMPNTKIPNEDFVFDFDLKKPHEITSLYKPNLIIEPCKGNGFYNSGNQSLAFDFYNSHIAFDNYEIKDLYLKASKQPSSNLVMTLKIDDFFDNEILKVRDINLESTIFDNVIDFNMSGIDTGFKIGIESVGRLLFKQDSIFLSMTDAKLKVDSLIWQLDSNAVCALTPYKFNVVNFILMNEGQSISVQGELGKNSLNTIGIDLKTFNVSTLNYFTKQSDIPQLHGISNGKILYTVVDGQNRFQSDFNIYDFAVEDDTIGDLSVYTKNYPNSSKQHLKIYIDKGLLDSLKIEGDIDYKSKNENLNLYARMPVTNIKIFEPFLKGVMSNMDGLFYTKDSLKISGSFSKPVMEGEMILKNANLLIDYLNVPVSFSASILSEKNRISIRPFSIYDDKNNIGKAKGFIFHDHFTNFNLNLNLYELNKFHVLNTFQEDNDLFYGQGYVNGSATFIGPFDDLSIRVNAKSTSGTKFFLPIDEGNAAGLPNYAHFKTTKKKVERKKEEFPIRLLEMDIEATTDAEVEIIFDEILGDKIKGTGSGNIKMEMNKSGDFYMFGTYIVDRGSYLFTAFDLYNKPFQIRRGGSISWYGDPLDARLDIVAFNSEVADPAPLLEAVSVGSSLNQSTTSTSATATRALTAESELYITGNLFSPEISFGLNFPKLQTEAGNVTGSLSPIISRIKSDKEEVSRQVFSLLLMKKFLPPLFAQADAGLNNAGSTALSSAGTDLLSSQLSNWLNKIDPNWRVNVIYKNGDITLPAEYGIILSSKFLNDKLSFDGSFSNYSTIPNINLEFKVTRKGNVKVKAYTRSSFNQVNTTTLSTPITTNGLGIVYTKEFNRLNLLGWLKRKKKKEDKAKDKAEE